MGGQIAVKQNRISHPPCRAAQEPVRVSWEPDEARPGLQCLEAGAAAGPENSLIRRNNRIRIDRKTAAAGITLGDVDQRQTCGFCEIEELRIGALQLVYEIAARAAGVVNRIGRVAGTGSVRISVKHGKPRTETAVQQVGMVADGRIRGKSGLLSAENQRVTGVSQPFGQSGMRPA